MVAAGLECVGERAAAQRLSRLAEAGVDAAVVLLVEKDAGAILAMGQAILRWGSTAGQLKRVHAGRDAVGLGPVLVEDTPHLGISDDDLVLTTAVAATVAGPVLNGRQ